MYHAIQAKAEQQRRIRAARETDDAARRSEQRAKNATRIAFERRGAFWRAVERMARAMYWRAWNRREQARAAFWSAVDAKRQQNIRAFRAARIRGAIYMPI